MSLRDSNLQKLQETQFDVLIVGGGINGAVSAAALAAKGVKVALIEQKDFASGTSQESSNLVWGGIKYLEGGELALVNKLCRSRNQLLRAYPATVKEVRFFTCLHQGFRWPRLLLLLGTWLYWLMGRGRTRRPRLLSRAEIAREEPVVARDRLKGGVEYSDCYLHDNDARFVFNFIRHAIDHGGICVNYCRLVAAKRCAQGWQAQVVDVEGDGAPFSVAAKILVNAAGPYVDDLNGRYGIATPYQHVFSKGVHLIVNRLTASSGRVLTFFANDGRMFFVIPMGTRSCIGTTDTRVKGLPARVTPEDRAFILSNINQLLALQPPLTAADIIAERCGVRPLVVKKSRGDGQDVAWLNLSRKHKIVADRQGACLSVFGGKLTDCLNVGEEVAREVAAMGITLRYPQFCWYGEPPAQVREAFRHQARLMGLDERTDPSSSEPLSQRLWRRYGRSAFDMLEDIRADPQMADILIAGAEYIRCELHQAQQREMVVRLEDFLRRRSKIALVTPNAVLHDAPGLMAACKILFGDQAERRFQEYFQRHGDAAAASEVDMTQVGC